MHLPTHCSSHSRNRWRSACALFIAVAGTVAGCHTIGPLSGPPASNPLLIRGQNPEQVWESMIDVLHEYHFEIERENRLDGVIETKWRVGSGLIEPWHNDSVTVHDRLESTLQSIRRRVLISLSPSPAGTLVSIQALKELEDPLPGDLLTPGSAVNQEVDPLGRNLDVTVGPAPRTEWVSKGRDVTLEQALASRLLDRVR